MGKAGHIPEGGDAAFVFAGIKPSLKADLQVMLLSFLMEVGRLLPLVSSSGNRTTYTSLSGYEGGVSRSDNVRNVWNVCSSFSILIFNCFLAPDHPELSLLSPAFRTLFWMVCLPWAFTLNGLVHSSFYHGGRNLCPVTTSATDFCLFQWSHW